LESAFFVIIVFKLHDLHLMDFVRN
jgi:hypothetical protein